MSSLYPNKIDKIPFVKTKNLVLPQTTPNSANSIPGNTLIRLYDSISQCEEHLSFTFISPGDIRVDATNILGTTVGRTLSVIKTNYSYNPDDSNDLGTSVLINLSGILDQSLISSSNPISCPSGDIYNTTPNNSPILLTQSPIHIEVLRQDNLVPIAQSNICATITPFVFNGKTTSYLSLYQLSQGYPFYSGEILNITFYFIGGE